MRQTFLTVKQNAKIAENVFEMVLTGDLSGVRAGQFVNLLIDGLYLRRPISGCDLQDDELTLVFKVVGKGTERLSKAQNGDVFDTLVGLGNGYDLDKDFKKPLLIGGGVGVPPLYLLAKRLVSLGKKPAVILGFNKKSEVFFEQEFKALGCDVQVVTVDGSYGARGFVTDAMDVDYDYFFTCGPEPMLKAVYAKSTTSGQFSFEERMGCGFGACMGCSCKTVTGYKRICKDGPILFKEEIVW
ncbi:MAG: dihydroorotate dehydrogenase electron transfer subunit [Clostridia bacterium]|nr:dihydroorotate dehydrogenase electron transfer subunit [Clostridia bacterium]